VDGAIHGWCPVPNPTSLLGMDTLSSITEFKIFEHV
jgi:hypothetical protein